MPSLADLSTLSRLLDEALDLDPAQAEAWLAALPEAHRHLLPQLREMLSAHRSAGHAGLMADGPKLVGGAADETVARPEDLVGPYRLIREIGRGGMGAVWLAERADGSLKRQVALKLPRLAWGAGLAERMVRERDIGALLEHPNIARLYDAGVDAQGRPYLALEYIDGQPLDAWCDSQALGVPERLRLFLQVARAVAYAHGRLVVHRDLKPSNVLVTADGQAHLLDFGIARLLHDATPGDPGLTQEQGRVLTPHYASPEQIQGETITVASDVYSLGVLLYELLTGRLPFQATSPAALEAAVLEGEPLSASSRAQDKATARVLRGEIDAILAKSLRRLSDERFRSADALADDIERYLDGDPVLAKPSTIWYRVRKVTWKHRIGVVASSVTVLALVAGAGIALSQALRAREAAARAEATKEFVVDAFRESSPDTPGNMAMRLLPADTLMALAAKQIETRYAARPRLQADLLGVAASIFAEMANDRLAEEYAYRHLQALQRIGDDDPRRQANALLLLAQTAMPLSPFSRSALEAEGRARRALELAGGDSALTVRARLFLADAMVARAQYAAAQDQLDAADGIVAAHRVLIPARDQVRAIALRADLTLRRSGLAAAAPHYRRGIDLAMLLEGPLSSQAVAMRLQLVDLYTAAGRGKEAGAELLVALNALRTLGGLEDIRASIAEARATARMFEAGLVSAIEAIPKIERAYQVVGNQQVPGVALARVEFILGKVLVQWGQVERAYALLGGAVPVLRLCECHTIAEELEWAIALGVAARNTGRHAEAGAEFQRAVRTRLRLGGDKLARAGTEKFVASNLRMQGRLDEASALVEVPPRSDGMSGATSGEADIDRELAVERASILLERGRPADALAALAPYANDAVFAPGRGFDSVSLVRATALCASGRPGGLQEIEAMTERASETVFAHTPELARLRALAGICALDAGQLTRARELAALARQALTAQPRVSSYYSAPLLTLERRMDPRGR
jgi:eukaryotic-like serine/threonine-protein kinase